jgi:hypothetical protein
MSFPNHMSFINLEGMFKGKELRGENYATFAEGF